MTKTDDDDEHDKNEQNPALGRMISLDREEVHLFHQLPPLKWYTERD